MRLVNSVDVPAASILDSSLTFTPVFATIAPEPSRLQEAQRYAAVLSVIS
jgi:hypothetical protein